MIAIYWLRDPLTYKIRYVGQTIRPLHARLSEHIRKARKQVNDKAHWIRELVSNGNKPIIEPFCFADNADQATDAEARCINTLINNGNQLFNIAIPINAVITDGRLTILPYERYLGTMSDAAIGRLFGIGQGSVGEARRKRGIPPYRHPHLNKRNISEYQHLLGVVSDNKIAKQFGVSKQAVIKHRVKAGIKPAPSFWHDKQHLLGTMSDTKLAKILGVDRKSVTRHRVKCGIPMYSKTI